MIFLYNTRCRCLFFCFRWSKASMLCNFWLCASETKHVIIQPRLCTQKEFDLVSHSSKHKAHVTGTTCWNSQKSAKHSQFVGQEGRRRGAKGDLGENSVTFHQISAPNCELSTLWQTGRQTDRELISITVRYLICCHRIENKDQFSPLLPSADWLFNLSIKHKEHVTSGISCWYQECSSFSIQCECQLQLTTNFGVQDKRFIPFFHLNRAMCFLHTGIKCTKRGYP